MEKNLEHKEVLNKVEVIKTKVEEVSEKHKTPLINQWTLHTIIVSKDNARLVAEKISNSLDSQHGWYADFKDDKIHYIILQFKNIYIL